LSYATSKGYRAEAAVVVYLSRLLAPCWRPRTTSRTDTDTGDVAGLPLVVSVKDHRALRLAAWTDEMRAMVKRSPWRTGVVVHKRAGKGDPGDWYVTLPLDLFVPLLHAYVTSTTTTPAAPRPTEAEQSQ
jgi:hypothetical protein